MSFLVRGLCVVLHELLKAWRRVYYNLRAFAWYRPAPWSTTIQGRLKFAHLPCRVTMGERCGLGDGLFLSTGREATITLGDDVTINAGCLLVASQAIAIGSRTAIGEYVSIRDQAHRFAPGRGVRGQGFEVAPIEIGENVWIGPDCIVTGEIKIGAGCTLLPGTVVSRDVPPGCLLTGNPARVLQRNFDNTALRSSLRWEIDAKDIVVERAMAS